MPLFESIFIVLYDANRAPGSDGYPVSGTCPVSARPPSGPMKRALSC